MWYNIVVLLSYEIGRLTIWLQFLLSKMLL